VQNVKLAGLRCDAVMWAGLIGGVLSGVMCAKRSGACTGIPDCVNISGMPDGRAYGMMSRFPPPLFECCLCLVAMPIS